eukprot:5203903-Pleurochrysis_carterae.AAC.1
MAAASECTPVSDFVATCPARINANGHLVDDSDEVDYQLTWVQPSISDPSEYRQHYKQVVVCTGTASVTVSVGDFVYVTPKKKGAAEIARVESLYDAGSAEGNEK